MRFNDLLKKEYILLDGAMGTMLQSFGLDAGEIPELLGLSAPEQIRSIHASYVQAGADIIYANTFGANRLKLADCGHTVEEIITAAIANAKAAAGERALVALDIGPIGRLLEPTGDLSFEAAYAIFKEQILAAKDADLIAIETMTDLSEVRAAVLAAKENSDLPILATMSFEENGRTFTGCSVSAMALTLEGLGVDALGFNCSLGPDKLLPMVKELSEWTDLPIVVKPNAGLPDPVTNRYDVLPEEFVAQILQMRPYGIKLAGGCCGTTPDYIRALHDALAQEAYTKPARQSRSAVCTPQQTVVIDQPRIIGERINPTGKKLFKEALLRGDIPYILTQAVEQQNAGADILDVNVGLPGVDEKQMMIDAVKGLIGVTPLPLQIDSSDPQAIEAALRIYPGKAIVNSVNGEAESLDTILPIVKKYGAAVVGLTLDKDGVPKTADKRFAIAERILKRAQDYGIRSENVFIDCLTLTASAEQDCVMETLHALKRVKTELGLKTVLGVSNISFGLPGRETVNTAFLTMALTFGLDLPIINPNIPAMTGAVRAYKLLRGIDRNSAEYVAAYAGQAPAAAPAKAQQLDLPYAVLNGLKQEAAQITHQLLETTPAMQIINELLIPALDTVGDGFEKGKIFLPQLILSAGVAESAFDVIKAHLKENGGQSASKGTIVLATVKGDIHDIGKNIVKVLLENYGYTVLDLGKDVDPARVLEAAKENRVELVGLSALMTTTLKGMRETIDLLRANYDCKIMVGGAVLTPEYAEEIGADYYARDAKESVDIAKKVFGA